VPIPAGLNASLENEWFHFQITPTQVWVLSHCKKRILRQQMLTPYHAKYFAHDLTRRAVSGMDRLSMSLFDAAVDF
jgi:hypothetical protein